MASRRDKWLKDSAAAVASTAEYACTSTRTTESESGSSGEHSKDDKEKEEVTLAASPSTITTAESAPHEKQDLFSTQGATAIATSSRLFVNNETPSSSSSSSLLSNLVVTAQLAGHDPLCSCPACLSLPSSPLSPSSVCSYCSTMNQDALVVTADFPNNNMLLLGVMDGHDRDGALVANHVRRNLPRLLQERLHPLVSQRAAVESTHNFIDKNNKEHDGGSNDKCALVSAALKDAFYETHDSLPPALVGGSTVSLVLQCCMVQCGNNELQAQHKLFVANVGDSVTCVAVASHDPIDVDIVYQTRQDRPDLPQEQRRIEAMGGKVLKANDDSNCGSSTWSKNAPARVMYSYQPASTINVNNNNDDAATTTSLTNTGTDCCWRPGVAMSRSIGDRDMIGVIPEPIVDVLDVSELLQSCKRAQPAEQGTSYILIVSATDGMTDYLSTRAIVESLAHAVSRHYNHPDENTRTATCSSTLRVVVENQVQRLVCRAALMWSDSKSGDGDATSTYRDDITIVASIVTTEAP